MTRRQHRKHHRPGPSAGGCAGGTRQRGGAHRAISGSNGRYEYASLEPGLCDLLIDGQPPRKVKVGEDGRLSGVVTRPVKASGLQSAEPAPYAALVHGGPGSLQVPRPAASDIRSVPTTNPTPVPK